MKLFPQTLINVRVEKGFDWQTHAGLQAMRAKVEPELEGRGRVLIRASGTEPVVRVMVEAEQVETSERAAQALADSLRA
ncbi:Phosphoglucosamine mutase [compost metagenome]